MQVSYLRVMAATRLPLPTRWVVGLLGVKLVCALGYAYLYFHVHVGRSDAWGYYVESLQLAGKIHSPADFFNLALPTHGTLGYWMQYNAWNNLKENLYLVVLMGLNLVTMANPYADTVIYAVLTFTGWLRLVRLFRALYPGRAPGWYVTPFLLPTFLFFYSGLPSDGLIFALLGWFAYDAYRLFAPTQGRPAVARFVLLCLLLLCFKVVLLVLLVILMPAWWLARRWGRAYGWACLLVLGVALLGATVPEQIGRQNEYLHFATALPEAPLTPAKYLSRLPEAVEKGLFRPFPWEGGYYWINGLEIWLLLALWAYGLARRLRRSFIEASWAWLTVIYCLLIGYTIPVMGALVRYRALLFPLVLGLCLLPLVRARRSDASA